VTTNGVQAVYLETHNWGKAAKFFHAGCARRPSSSGFRAAGSGS
jgi:hypothetical protein